MTYDPNEKFTSAPGLGSGLRCVPTSNMVKSFSTGTLLLAALTPVAFNTSTGFWVIWSSGVNEINTITANATPATAGTFTLSVDGETTATIAFDATAAVIQAALEAMSNVAPGDVVAVATTSVDLGDASAVVTLTWGGNWTNKDVTLTADFSGLTGNDHVLATSTAGVAGNGANIIKGFVWPDPVQLVSGSEVMGQVVLAGKIHRDDIPIPAGESQATLDAALQVGPRDVGLIIEGLAGVR